MVRVPSQTERRRGEILGTAHKEKQTREVELERPHLKEPQPLLCKMKSGILLFLTSLLWAEPPVMPKSNGLCLYVVEQLCAHVWLYVLLFVCVCVC